MNLRLVITALISAVVTCCSCEKPEQQSGSQAQDCMISFEKKGNIEFFNVAVRDEYKKNTWYVFRINHYSNHDPYEYMDLWRINWAYRGTFENGTMTRNLDKLLNDGESECVFKDYGEGLGTSSHNDTYDFTGGFHGDERIDLDPDCFVSFYVDDVALEPSELEESFAWRECSKFHYVQRSNMHKTALKIGDSALESDHHIVANHTKKTTFGEGGYLTENTLTMQDEIDFYWYNGICCVGTCIADKGCNESMQTVSFDRSGANRLDELGRCEYLAWSNKNEIEVHVETHVSDGAEDKDCRTFIWDTKNYAKYYRRFPSNGAYRTSKGEVFASNMSVKFSSR